MKGDFPFRHERGYVSAFTRAQAPGAMDNGTRVEKCASEEGDGNPDGSLGTILGSFSDARIERGALLYFVEWDERPTWAIAVMAFKLKRAGHDH
jgi:hypothetical protein